MSDTQPTPEQPHPLDPPVSGTSPVPEQPTEPIAAAQPLSPAPPRTALQWVRLRDQAFGVRSLVAVGLAGAILGGLGGFGIHAATDNGQDDRSRFGPDGGSRGGFGFPGHGQLPGGPNGMPQQLPPGVQPTAPPATASPQP